jgi:ribosomal-protein-alanine N-acetyltransferase
MTVDPPVRLAQPGDAESIATMSRELIEVGLPWNWRPSRVLAAISNPETNVAVISAGAELLAFGIMEYQERDAYLALLAVSRSSQRKGFGSAVLHWLEASAVAAGAERIRLETRRDNAPARTFYNELSYHEVGIRRGRYSDGIDGIVLEKWFGSRAGSD